MLVKSGRRNPGRVRAIVYAVLVHAVVIGLLVIGFRWTIQPSGEKVVQAVAVPETAPRKPEVPDKRQQEEEARKKAEAEKAEAEKVRQTELRKKQEQEEQQRKEAERRKMEAVRKQKEQEEQQKRAAAAERQKEEKRQQQHAEKALQEQLAAEEKARQAAAQAAAQAARAATAIDKYTALIEQRVSRSWSRPLGSTKGLKCKVRVRLTPSGEVLGAMVVRSSGNQIFDRSVQNAVYKAAPLPLPDDPSLFDNFREIDFIFDPDKEREPNT